MSLLKRKEKKNGYKLFINVFFSTLEKPVFLFANHLGKLLNISILTVFPIIGKLLKSHHCIKEERKKMSTITARYLFCLSFQESVKSMWSALFLNSCTITTYYMSCNQPLGQATLLKQP